MKSSNTVERSLIYHSVLESCTISPIGVKLGDAVSNSLEKAIFDDGHVEAAQLRQLICSIGAKLRPEFSSISDKNLSRYLGRGVFFYEGLIADVLGVCLASTEMMETAYVEKHQLISEIRYLSIALCGTQNVPMVDALLLQPWSFSDAVWRKSLSWVSTYDRFDDFKKTSLLIKSMKLGLNINEGDFMIQPRFKGIKSIDLKTVLLRCATGIQSGFSFMLELLNIVLSGLNRMVAKMDLGRTTSVLDSDEAFARLYYACCQLADTLNQRPSSYEYLLQRACDGEWKTFKRTGSPSWSAPHASLNLSPFSIESSTFGFVGKITSHGQDPKLNWRYVRTLAQGS